MIETIEKLVKLMSKILEQLYTFKFNNRIRTKSMQSIKFKRKVIRESNLSIMELSKNYQKLINGQIRM